MDEVTPEGPIPLHWRDVGQGPAVLLIHGVPNAEYQFAPLADALSKNHRVLYPDLPGYGTSPAQRVPYRSELTYAAILAGLRARDVKNVAIVGHSFGGHHALALASMNPDVRVRAAVSLGGFAAVTEEHARSLAGLAEAAEGGADFAGADLLPQIVGLWHTPRWQELHPECVEQVRRTLAAGPVATMCAELRAVGRGDVRSQLRDCKTPLTLRVGSLDQATPVAYSEEVARLAPHVDLQVVEGIGHTILVEDAEATWAAIARAVR